MEYEHKGVKIDLLASGMFSARIDGKLQNAPSLAAMKGRIDKAQAASSVFEPFDGFLIEPVGYDEKRKDVVKTFRVVGIEQTGRKAKYRNATFAFKTEGARSYGDYSPRSVILNTPENVALAKKLIAFNAETRRISKERDATSEAMEARLVKRECPQQ